MVAKPRNTKRSTEEDSAIEQLFRSNMTNIVPVELEKEMRSSFIDYAMSVITDRALPDVRDGLKPVHRRILYSMYTQGFTHDKPYRKCATTVGDVLGRFHPHGDAAVYDSLVRLAQDFSMRHILVEGHGNFGSRDGDPPAAYRYTEARLPRLSVEMMSDINKNTVDFQPNFDEHEMEPTVLPAHFPNLLVNGSTGIAVGMATNIPPHNLGEVIDGTIYLLHHPDASVQDLMQYIPGPDFPTGGTILGVSGIHQAYETGKGRILVRATSEIETMDHGRQQIVVHDLPYMVNKARLIEKIAELVKDKKIEGISFVRDESDRNEAVRIVIELKRDANANVVLNRLFRMTQLQESFSTNILALVPENGVMVPRVITLKDALVHYANHQKDVVTRRTQFDLDKARARQHIIEGLLKAIDHIDEVIQIIRSSKHEEAAKERLSERYGFSDRQAQHIVDMRLGRLTGLEQEKLQNEYQSVLAQIEFYVGVLSDEQKLIEVIVQELEVIKHKYADERRTGIDPFAEEITDESLIKEEDVVITMTHFGYVKRQPIDTYTMQHRGGRGIIGLQMREDDFVQQIITTSTHHYLLFFTNTGRVFRLKGYQIPEESRQAKGLPVVNLLQLSADEKIQSIVPLGDDDAQYLFFVTQNGLVKRTPLSEFDNINRSGLIAISLREDDALVGVAVTRGEEDVLLITQNGMSIRFKESDCRAIGRKTYGYYGIRLAKDDRVISYVQVRTQSDVDSPSASPKLFVVTENGFGKKTDFSQFRVQSRAGKGLIVYKPNERTGRLVGALPVMDDQDIILINNAGVIIRIASSEINEYGRTAMGVKVMRANEAKVVDLAVVQKSESDDSDESGVVDHLNEQNEADLIESTQSGDIDSNLKLVIEPDGAD